MCDLVWLSWISRVIVATWWAPWIGSDLRVKGAYRETQDSTEEADSQQTRFIGQSEVERQKVVEGSTIIKQKCTMSYTNRMC